MTRALVLGPILALLLGGCFARTTSLGDVGDQSSASSTSDEEGESVLVPDDPKKPDKGGLGPVCHGYSWDPKPTETECEYFLPEGEPSGDPRLTPATWNTYTVTIDVIPQDAPGWRHGFYVGSSERCGDLDGWYYKPPHDAERPSRFVICPKSCASVEANAWLRISAISYCE